MTVTTDPAAELREHLAADSEDYLAELLDAALSEERRLTVERIRERLVKAVESRDFMAGPLAPSAMLAILDEIGVSR